MPVFNLRTAWGSGDGEVSKEHLFNCGLGEKHIHDNKPNDAKHKN
jgi:hypothetical protein